MLKTKGRRGNLIFDPPPLGSVLYLPGLPGSGPTIQDRSPYGNHGTIIGATWTRNERGLYELVYDGDDYANCGNNPILNFTSGDFSIETWFTATALEVTNNYLFTRGSLGADGYQLYLNDDPAVVFATSQAGASQYSTAAPALNTRYHLIVVRSGVSGLIYLNGVDATTVNQAHTNPLTNTKNGLVGISNNLVAGGFKGKNSLTAVYNIALTADWVAARYNQLKHLYGVW